MRIQLRYPDDTPAGYVIYENNVSKVYDNNGNLIFETNGLFPPAPSKVNYSWIEKILENGIPDGRKRFILYVASRYLVNVKGLSEDEALEKIKEFYYKSGSGKIYDAWIRSVIKGVKSKGFRPPSLKKLQEKDRELYEEIMKVLS
ncbi:DNA primase noncatalytic subunit PriX [Acidianus sulfidivorans JP7]|uniref:DNA primase noncatalytic subunit PriX n=1 Tax=Acidianus sulfidivorans JP7 TaxID=619593 RepID=A0A2U9IN48_9CREN|nr:DNA primase noncatalytic subunit PriX [Acidianus sulfidivorans]AWR97427.1 DNA primase noncatalytic subunit PriX [Acidianus sulfidivorans JP7]